MTIKPLLENIVRAQEPLFQPYIAKKQGPGSANHSLSGLGYAVRGTFALYWRSWTNSMSVLGAPPVIPNFGLVFWTSVRVLYRYVNSRSSTV